MAQLFSSEFYEISKKNFFTEHLRTTATVRKHSSLFSAPLWETFDILSVELENSNSIVYIEYLALKNINVHLRILSGTSYNANFKAIARKICIWLIICTLRTEDGKNMNIAIFSCTQFELISVKQMTLIQI